MATKPCRSKTRCPQAIIHLSVRFFPFSHTNFRAFVVRQHCCTRACCPRSLSRSIADFASSLRRALRAALFQNATNVRLMIRSIPRYMAGVPTCRDGTTRQASILFWCDTAYVSSLRLAGTRWSPKLVSSRGGEQATSCACYGHRYDETYDLLSALLPPVHAVELTSTYHQGVTTRLQVL